MTATERATLLLAVVGSTAYGLAREGSDVDRLGVFAAPTLEVAGLDWHDHRATWHRVVPGGDDVTLQEVGKFCRLALKCNPTLLELLFLPDHLVEEQSDLGRDLRDLGLCFLHEQGVRNAYGGYAHQQATRLRNRGDSFSADTRRRTAKHGRHLLRLLRQGRQLLAEARLDVKVESPEDYFAFDDYTPEQMLDVYAREKRLFDETSSVLPSEPGRDAVAAYLRVVRRAYL